MSSSSDVGVVLCRHAATAVNLEKRFLSSSDPPLCAEGRAQAQRLAEALGAFDFDRCIVSPMRRCMETREIVAPALPFVVEPALREVDFGTWEGKSLEWVETHAPELLAQRRHDPVRFRPPQGESIEEAAVRVGPLARQLQTARATLVIGHRITLGILERLLRDLPIESRFVVPLEPAEFRVVGG